MTDDRELLAAYRSARADQTRAAAALVEAETAAGTRKRPSRWPFRAALAVFVIALAVAVGGVVEWIRSTDGFTDRDYIDAATARVEMLLSPDYRHADQVKRILSLSTGRFYDEFGQSADAYSKFVAQAGTVSTGRVTGAGVDRRLGDDAEVLVAASVDLAAAADHPASTRDFRLRVILAPENGVLKLSMVQYLP